jgi:hypothetical protein
MGIYQKVFSYAWKMFVAFLFVGFFGTLLNALITSISFLLFDELIAAHNVYKWLNPFTVSAVYAFSYIIGYQNFTVNLSIKNNLTSAILCVAAAAKLAYVSGGYHPVINTFIIYTALNLSAIWLNFKSRDLNLRRRLNMQMRGLKNVTALTTKGDR